MCFHLSTQEVSSQTLCQYSCWQQPGQHKAGKGHWGPLNQKRTGRTVIFFSGIVYWKYNQIWRVSNWKEAWMWSMWLHHQAQNFSQEASVWSSRTGGCKAQCQHSSQEASLYQLQFYNRSFLLTQKTRWNTAWRNSRLRLLHIPLQSGPGYKLKYIFSSFHLIPKLIKYNHKLKFVSYILYIFSLSTMSNKYFSFSQHNCQAPTHLSTRLS